MEGDFTERARRSEHRDRRDETEKKEGGRRSLGFGVALSRCDFVELA